MNRLQVLQFVATAEGVASVQEFENETGSDWNALATEGLVTQADNGTVMLTEEGYNELTQLRRSRVPRG